jgi:preprotein translocase subunit SecF
MPGLHQRLKAIVFLVLMLLLWWFNWYTAAAVLLLLIADIVVTLSLTPVNKGEFVFSKDIQKLFPVMAP